MIKELKNSFMQAAFGSTVWIAFLVTLFGNKVMISSLFMWRLLAMGTVFGIIFGIIYPYLWNYSTLKARTNIGISTFANTFCGLLVVYLFSQEMFYFVLPFTLLIFILTLIGHIIGFYFYSKSQNKKIAQELNTLHR